jgi:hypothetical protein
LHLDRRLGPIESLKISIRHQELDALDASLDHVIYCVAPAPADADDFDSRARLWRFVTEGVIQPCAII